MIVKKIRQSEVELIHEKTLELLEETEPVEEEKIESKSWIGLVLIAGTLTFLLVGALIFRIMSRKNRY